MCLVSTWTRYVLLSVWSSSPPPFSPSSIHTHRNRKLTGRGRGLLFLSVFSFLLLFSPSSSFSVCGELKHMQKKQRRIFEKAKRVFVKHDVLHSLPSVPFYLPCMETEALLLRCFRLIEHHRDSTETFVKFKKTHLPFAPVRAQHNANNHLGNVTLSGRGNLAFSRCTAGCNLARQKALIFTLWEPRLPTLAQYTGVESVAVASLASVCLPFPPPLLVENELGRRKDQWLPV